MSALLPANGSVRFTVVLRDGEVAWHYGNYETLDDAKWWLGWATLNHAQTFASSYRIERLVVDDAGEWLPFVSSKTETKTGSADQPQNETEQEIIF